jgi:surface protein
MFREASSFNRPVGGWVVDKVEDMTRMFRSASSFNQDISGWVVDKVEDMSWMFYEASAFNQDLSGWQVSNVWDMGDMFKRAVAFDQDLGWCVDDGVDLEDAFEDAKCESTSCGVEQGACPSDTPEPTPEPGQPSVRPIPAPTPRPQTAAQPTPAPTRTFAPTPSPYEYAPTADATPYCRLQSQSVCWGNMRRFLEVEANGPFEGLDFELDDDWTVGLAFADLDNDGTLRPRPSID